MAGTNSVAEDSWLTRTNAWYAEHHNLWGKYQDFYDGGEAVRSSAYLLRHTAEDDKIFDARKDRLVYVNYIASPLQQIIDGVYEQGVSRGDIEEDSEMAEFIKNVDRCENDAESFFRRVCLEASLKGSAAVLIDMAKFDKAETIAQIPEEMRFPYFVFLKPEDILDWRIDPITKRLIALKICRAVSENVDLEQKAEAKKQYYIWYRDRIQVYNEKALLLEEIKNPLDEIPLVPCYGDKVSTLQGLSIVRDIVGLAQDIMNLVSEAREFIKYNALAQMMVEGATQEQLEAISRSNTKAISYPEGVSPPQILQANMAPYDAIQSLVNEQINQIYTSYKLRLINKGAEQESGISKEHDYIPTRQTLMGIARHMQDVESACFYFFERWQGAEPDKAKENRIQVQYPQKFDPFALDEEIEYLIKMQSISLMPAVATAEALKRILRQFFGDEIKDDVMEQIEKEIDENADETIKQAITDFGFGSEEDEDKKSIEEGLPNNE